MAISIVSGNRGTATEKTSDTSLAITTSAAMSAGNYALVAVVIDNVTGTDGATTDVSVSDGTHTYTRLEEQTESGGAAGAGVTSALFLAKLTSGLASGATITITIGSATTAKGAGVAELSCAAGQQIAKVGGGGQSTTGTTYSIATSGNPSSACLYVGMIGCEDELDTACTLDSGYTALAFGSIGSGTSGANNTNVRARVGTLANTSTGDTFDATGLTTGDKAAIIARLVEQTAATEYTDSGTAILLLVPSTVQEGLEWVDSATIGLLLTVSAVENAQFVESDTVRLNLTPSGTDQLTRKGAIYWFELEVPVATGTSDAATIELRFTPSATELADFVDSATVGLLFTVSALEERQQYDADTVALRFTPSGTDVADFVDTSTVGLALTPSTVQEGIERTDSATVNLVFTPSGTDEYTPGAGGTEYVDGDTAVLRFTPSATEVAEFVDSGTPRLSFTPSGTEQLTRKGAIYWFELEIPAATGYTDAATAQLRFTPSSTEVFEAVDSDTVAFALTPSGTDEYIPPSGVEAGTVRGLMGLYISEEPTNIDTDTLLFRLTPSATENMQTVDAATAPLLFTPSAVEERESVDISTIPVLLTPSAVETLERVDAATAILSYTPSGIEIAAFVDTSTVPLRYTITGDDFFGGEIIDSATIPLRLTPSTVYDVYFPFDVLLAGTMYRRYEMEVSQRWGTGQFAGVSRYSGMMLNRKWSGVGPLTKWTAILGRKWEAKYLGRGKD